MRWLRAAIWFYIAGLFTFYLFATFDTYVWDIVYFSWSKLADCGWLFWGVLYFGTEYRSIVKWLFYFSILRFVFDIQSFYTNLGANNEVLVSLSFLALISIVGYMSLKEDSDADLWLKKNIFKR